MSKNIYVSPTTTTTNITHQLITRFTHSDTRMNRSSTPNIFIIVQFDADLEVMRVVQLVINVSVA